MAGEFPFAEEKIFSGAYGKLIDENGQVLQETAEFTSRVEPEFEEIVVAGSRWKGNKLKGLKGTGTLKLMRISADLRRRVAEAAASGAPFVTQFVGEVGNDLGDTERVLLQNVKFTGNVDLVKFTGQDHVEDDLEFVFNGFHYL